MPKSYSPEFRKKVVDRMGERYLHVGTYITITVAITEKAGPDQIEDLKIHSYIKLGV